MRFGTAEAAPGELAKGFIELGYYPDGPLVSPVLLARGASPGPRLLVQCLIHGGENVGPVSLARFLREIDLSALKGSIAALLVANPLGARTHSRLTPQDGMNLNRVFPGKPDGTVSEQLADRLLSIAGAEGGDAVLDLHSGGELTITAHYVIFDAKGDGAAERESRRLAGCVGSRFQWGSSEDWLDGAYFTNVTRQHNKAALIVESGGGARVTEDDLTNFRVTLHGLTRALGMLPGEVPEVSDIRHGGNAVHVKCRRGGYWRPLIAPGDDMVGGQPMGEMIDIFGEVVETITCPLPRAWVGSIKRAWMPLFNGDQVVEVVERIDA
ncbi:succinylglutamate desuccinylase/aspartoacylase family protein [Roseomonas sp. BN140053]|uniref:succinylglutamate desuccinylase/aspartoacylase family protein n=1 Tax=Roseomonas sp. BN140053 TaxID=3391898 RepID=UPI0039E97981